MKTIKLQNKDYIQVSERLKYFRENFRDGRIDTSYEIAGERVIFNAKIYDGDKLIASGTGMKNTAKEFELEKAETRAIGRALAIAGIGLDAGIASYDEMADFYRQEAPKKDLVTEAQLNLLRRYEGVKVLGYIGAEFGVERPMDLTKEQARQTISYMKGGN